MTLGSAATVQQQLASQIAGACSTKMGSKRLRLAPDALEQT
jgi:hypothetical protein